MDMFLPFVGLACTSLLCVFAFVGARRFVRAALAGGHSLARARVVVHAPRAGVVCRGRDIAIGRVGFVAPDRPANDLRPMRVRRRAF